MQREKDTEPISTVFNVIKFQPKVNKKEEELFLRYRSILGLGNDRAARIIAKRNTKQPISKEDEFYIHFRIIRQYYEDDAIMLSKINAGQEVSDRERKLLKNDLGYRFESRAHLSREVEELRVMQDLCFELSQRDALFLKYIDENQGKVIAYLKADRDLGRISPEDDEYLKYVEADYNQYIARSKANTVCGLKVSNYNRLTVQIYDAEFNRLASKSIKAVKSGSTNAMFDKLFLTKLNTGIDKHTAYGQAKRECWKLETQQSMEVSLLIRTLGSCINPFANSILFQRIDVNKVIKTADEMTKKRIYLAKE